MVVVVVVVVDVEPPFPPAPDDELGDSAALQAPNATKPATSATPKTRKPAEAEATWNAVCLADFGDGGVAFVAEPQIPPRNVNWAAQGKWVHYAKIAFEKYFLHKIRRGESEPFYERWFMEGLGIRRLTKAR